MNDLKKITIISRYTFLELYKSRILVNVVLLGIGLLAICFVAAEFTYGVPQKVALDFGLGMLSISGVGIAIFMGVNLLAKELEYRTVYMILSRPLRRIDFLIGRIFGMIGILFVNLLVLAVLTVSIYLLLGGTLDLLILWAILFSFLESVIILLFVVLASMITNTVLAVIAAISIEVLGHAVTDPSVLHFAYGNKIIIYTVKFYSFFFPDFSKLNLKDYVLYQQTISPNILFGGLAYGICYGIILLLISAYIFERRNLD